MVHEGRFQEDLYYRLDVIRIELPPLRDRPQDIPLVAAHFIEKHARRNGRSIDGLDGDAVDRLVDYSWPGNIRELENTIERAGVLSAGERITSGAIALGSARLRPAAAPSLNLRHNAEWIEQETIRRALEMMPVKRQAARAMGISPRALAYYLNKYPTLDHQRRVEPTPVGDAAVETGDAPMLAIQHGE